MDESDMLLFWEFPSINLNISEEMQRNHKFTILIEKNDMCCISQIQLDLARTMKCDDSVSVFVYLFKAMTARYTQFCSGTAENYAEKTGADLGIRVSHNPSIKTMLFCHGVTAHISKQYSEHLHLTQTYSNWRSKLNIK